MKNRPIHENLDTSFVNLSALLKYLRRRGFVGHVRIELSGYEADIYLTPESHLRVREYDQIAGRVAEGEEALQRILIRSREPGGIINVYQTVAEIPASENGSAAEKQEIEKEKPLVNGQTPSERGVRSQPPIESQAAANAYGNGKPKPALPVSGGDSKPKTEPAKTEEKTPASKTLVPNVPFEFSNRVEEKAKQFALSREDREMLLNLTGELLGTVDHALRMAKLDFPSAFRKACMEIAADYPFLKTLDYGKGKIYYADEQINPKFFVAGLLEALRRILEKLGANSRYGEVYRYTVQRVLALLHQRRPIYDRFSIAQPLEKILGA